MSETSSNQNVSREIERFSAYLKAEKRSENTVRQYTDTLRDFLKWYDKPQGELTKADLQNWKGYLAIDRDYTENTMSTRIAAMNQYLERILERPDLKMRGPRIVFRTKIPLTEDEVRSMLDEARKPRSGRSGRPNNSDMSRRDHAAICAMYYGGLRANEVTNLRLSDLDLGDRKLRVHQGKGMDFSMVNLSDEAVEGIRDYLKHGRPTPAKPEYADRVFLTMVGTPLQEGKLCALVKKVAFWAGIEKRVHPHILRHSMITHMAERGLSASFIQAQSRHKSLDMVQRYTHLSAQSVRMAYDLAFPGQKPPEEKAKVQKQEEGQKQTGLAERVVDAVLMGKLSLEDVGKIGKLLSDLDGAKKPQITPNFEGYA